MNIQPHHAFRLLSAAVLLALFTISYATQGSGSTAAEDAFPDADTVHNADTVVVSGRLSGPESVLHDTVGDVYLVSHVNGQPSAMDDNGFILRVSSERDVTALRWIDGQQANATLNAPKGMALWGDPLFVSGIDTALIGAGLPEKRAKRYESTINEGDVVLGVEPKSPDNERYFQNEWKSHQGKHIHTPFVTTEY